MDLPPSGHEAVLIQEVLELLAPKPGQIFIDCTIGRGGHALAIARQLGPTGLLIGLDVDPRNLEFAASRLNNASSANQATPQHNNNNSQTAGLPTIRLFHANFAELPQVLSAVGLPPANAVDGILADLGVSTNQLFDPAYGLSFSQNMPLDMRLDPRTERSAADLVNTLPEEDLANVLYELAQERYSRRIARKIVESRRFSPINSTESLAALVCAAIGSRGGAPNKIDPATRTFLALRMAVNREMENLDALLASATGFLKPSGTLAVISFQSMEDRRVKQAFRMAGQAGKLAILTSKPLTASARELAANPRSRSAKLRAAQRL